MSRNNTSALITKTLVPLITGPKFAVIYCNNLQYKIGVGDVIAVQRIRAEIGSSIHLKKVLMIGGPRFTAIGRPFLANANVTATVEEHKRMRNVISFFAPYARRSTRWVDNAHAVSFLRFTAIEYEPEFVAEIDKYKGVLLPSFNPQEHTNPVYGIDDGYDIYRKKDKKVFEEAGTFLEFMQEESDKQSSGDSNNIDNSVRSDTTNPKVKTNTEAPTHN